jgi:mannose-6-phosphate isomerase-like protein (cupin superfamily)
MRFIFATLAAAAFAMAMPSQAETTGYASADQVQSMIATGRSGPLASLGPWRANLDVLTSPQAVPLTQTQAELIYVSGGRGTVVVNGVPLPLEKGAAVYVPANASRQVSNVEGSLAIISIRLPAGAVPAEAKTFASAQDFRAMIAGGKNTALVSLPAPYRDTLQIRKEPQLALLHEKDDEYVYIADGNGTFTVGGAMNDPKPTTPGNFSANGIAGGMTYKVSPGAVIFVPANAPHQFSGISGQLISIDLHLPHAD